MVKHQLYSDEIIARLEKQAAEKSGLKPLPAQVSDDDVLSSHDKVRSLENHAVCCIQIIKHT